MGYTHSWSRIETPTGPLPAEPADAYGRLALDTLRSFAAAERAGIALADGAATPRSRAMVDEGGIWFTGARPDHCETSAGPAQPGEPWRTELPGHRWWDACKTNRQPYDTVVRAVLIRAGFHYRDSIRVSSDGARGTARSSTTTNCPNGRPPVSLWSICSARPPTSVRSSVRERVGQPCAARRVHQHHTGLAWAHCERCDWRGRIRSSAIGARSDAGRHVCTESDDSAES